MPRTEIETHDQLAAVLEQDQPLRGLRLQGLDLSGPLGLRLMHADAHGLVVLGGTLPAELEHALRANGATIFPTDPGAPIDPYRARLYAPTELYDGLLERGYPATPDARAYAWSRNARLASDTFVTLLRAIHDHSMQDSLDELVEGRRVVGVMGGHAVERGTAAYGGAARLGQRLADLKFLVATGGGPGAMEAANLGAWCTTRAALDDALDRVAAIPSFRPSIDDWARVAWQVRADHLPDPAAPARSVGVPTWFYGHEPPNLFATVIAKFFSNALREDLLIARCNGGIVVLPGAAGTVQEIFQTAARLYYTQELPPPPLVLVGRRHWTQEIPLWSALQTLARDRPMAAVIHLVDSTDEAADLLVAPRSSGGGGG